MASLLELVIARGLRLPYARLQPALHSATLPRSSCCATRIAAVKASASFLPGPSLAPCRQLHATARCLKKGGGKASKGKPDDALAAGGGEDPSDFTELQDAIAKAQAALKDALSQLKPGGKFNPELIENLRVSLDKSGKNTVKLKDLAQCVPRGRTMQVISGEKDHAKAISSAILISDLNLTPQPDATNPLQLNIQLPPPTAQSRHAAVKGAQDLGEKANTAVRNARGVQQKKLRAIALAKTARPDDLKKAGDKMEKVVADGAAGVKTILDQVKKALESG